MLKTVADERHLAGLEGAGSSQMSEEQVREQEVKAEMATIALA